jgi:asparagine synthase (glutamine-hydrolysing)
MCGITGIVSASRPAGMEQLKRGTDALVHRGPDGEGFYIAANKTAALGHRRLSIVDLSTGSQPISSEDGRKHIVVNGEFYGHADIRRGLEALGHVFKTKSDSEIALHLYEEYGTACLEHLRGEFAFILWDEDKQMLFAARDRFGIKPLCYTQYNGQLLLASEAKALFAMGAPAAWDDYSFFHAAQLQYTPQDRTLFKNIFQLKPGHALVAKGGRTETFKYWDLDFLPEAQTDKGSEKDLIDAFAAELEQSIRLRLMADVPVCFHLSGGLDSASVLGLAASITGKQLDAFTVSFGHEGYDELPIAEEMAKTRGARLHAVHVTQEDLVRELPDAVYYGEGLAINGHLAGKYMLNRAIRRAGFKVALTGEGSDEILAGYPHLRQDLLRAEASNDVAAKAMAKIYATNGASAGVQIALGAQLPTQAVKAALGYTPAFLEAKASLGSRMSGVLSDGFAAQFTRTDSYAELMAATPVAEQLKGRHPVNQSSWIWAKTALANYILRTLGDGMEMAQSVEGRLPFLDHKLFETARRLPLGLKIKGMVEKYVLREAAKPHITDTIYRRQKHPFMAPPVTSHANAALMELVGDTLQSASFAALPFFDRKKALAALHGLPAMAAPERAAMEPVLMTMLTANMLQQEFGL